MIHTPPIYDRRRLETLVAQHRLRVYLAQKKAAHKSRTNAGVKAPR